jgi:hypothetical protein
MDEINFAVTERLPYVNSRPKNLSKKCEDHFFPRQSADDTAIGYVSLDIFDIGGLITICIIMTICSVFAFVWELLHWKFIANRHFEFKNNIEFQMQFRIWDENVALTRFLHLKNSLVQHNTVVIRHFAFSATQNAYYFEMFCELKIQVHNRRQYDHSVELLEAFKYSFHDQSY